MAAETHVTSIEIISILTLGGRRVTHRPYGSPGMHGDGRRERIVAIGGILFPLSIIVLIAWPPPESVQWPSFDPAPEELVAFSREAGGYLLITNSINVLGILLVIGFFWSLYRVLSRAQPHSRVASTTGYAAGL